MANEADILVRFGADVGPLKKGAKEASTSLDKVAGATKNLKAPVVMMVTTIAAAGLAFLAFSRHVADSATELKNQATVANTSITNFKNMAFAAKSVGVEQDTLADILKDVNDKIGDFVQTGAGPMVDFFEKIGPMVGVTADNFKDLSGDQALKLYVDSLNSANLSQSDMVFYMEAIASDATKLLPLYADQSAELERLSQKYSDVNDELALTANQADALGDLKESFDLLGVTAGNAGTQVISSFANPLSDFLDTVSSIIPVVTNKFIDFFNVFLDAESYSSIEHIDTQISNITETMKEMIDYNDKINNLGADYPMVSPAINQDFKDNLAIQQDLLDTFILQKNVLEEKRLQNVPTGGTGAGATGEGELGDVITSALEEFHALLLPPEETLELKGQWIKTVEDMEKEHLTEMARLNKEYVDGRLSSGEDFSKTDLERQEEWAKASKAIDSAKHLEQRNAASQFFGGMADLMSSGVKREFEIGKAAAIAQASIDGVSSAISSFKYGASIGGPVLGGLMAASSAVSTGMLINKLMSSSHNSGSATTPALPTTDPIPDTPADPSSPSAPRSQSQSLYIEGIDPGSMFSGEQVRNLIDKINEAGSDGKQVMLV